MPCRALEAFRRFSAGLAVPRTRIVLMPCRALEAFRRLRSRRSPPSPAAKVLMPCRALEAFRLKELNTDGEPVELDGLNALSGIGGVQTIPTSVVSGLLPRLRLNALSGIGGVQTNGLRVLRRSGCG